MVERLYRRFVTEGEFGKAVVRFGAAVRLA
jgi:hypothetical protein